MFSDENSCLDWIFSKKFGDHETCPKCDTAFNYHRVKERNAYQCTRCYNQIYPLAGTVMAGSTTPLAVWFGIAYMIATNKKGSDAEWIERMFQIPLLTARRISFKIRSVMAEEVEPLTGIIEIDESFLGGRKELDKVKDRRGIGQKMIVFGMIQRDGNLILRHVKHKNRKTLAAIIEKSVSVRSTIYSDQYPAYNCLGKKGYQHRAIKKKAHKEFRRGINTNSIENVWRNLKAFLEAHRNVSPQHLQVYLDEYCFKYNRRDNDKKCLSDLLERLISTFSPDDLSSSISSDQPAEQFDPDHL